MPCCTFIIRDFFSHFLSLTHFLDFKSIAVTHVDVPFFINRFISLSLFFFSSSSSSSFTLSTTKVIFMTTIHRTIEYSEKMWKSAIERWNRRKERHMYAIYTDIAMMMTKWVENVDYYDHLLHRRNVNIENFTRRILHPYLP